ncbi:hypothetical protein [Labilibaculum euxinus]
MIRQKFLKELNEIINAHDRFDSYNFEIKPAKENRTSSITVTITYLQNNNFKFELALPNSQTTAKDEYSATYKFKGVMTPGPFALKETFSFSNVEPLSGYITSWLDCIWEELLSNPVISEMDRQREELNKMFVNFEETSEEFFTQEEAGELTSRLDELEKKFQSELSKEIKDKDELKKEIQELHKDIETLKVTISSFNKKGWIKEFYGKSFKWLQNPNNKKALKNGYSFVREVLPEDYKAMLPEVNQ